MDTLDPLALTGAAQTLQLPSEFRSGGSLRLANESPYAYRVAINGVPIGAGWLSAWSADVFPLPAAGGLTLKLTPSLIASSQNSPSSTMLLTVAGPGETIPGSYPMALDRSALALVVNALGTRLSVTSPAAVLTPPISWIGTTTAQAYAIDPATLAMSLAISWSSSQLNDSITVSAVGNNSGLDYIAALNAGTLTLQGTATGANNRLVFGVDPVDTIVTVQVTTGTHTRGNVNVSALFTNAEVIATALTNLPTDMSDRPGRQLGLLSGPVGGDRTLVPVALAAGSATMNGSRVSIIGGVAGQRIYVWSAHVYVATWVGGNSVYLEEDTVNLPRVIWSLAGVGAVAPGWSGHGAPFVAAGHGLNITSGGNMAVNYAVEYSQF